MSENNSKIKIGIIGGSLFDSSIVKNATEKSVTTIYGNPSDNLLLGEIHGVPVVVLSRHSRDHSIMPSKVNYRANIWALKTEGCTHILVTTAVGSLREEIKPGDFLIPHDFIDRTRKREDTFYDGEPGHLQKVVHIPMCPPYSEPLREVVIKTLEEDMKLGDKLHKQGIAVCIDGPRFSTKAESNMYRLMGGDIVNMTAVPEIQLAKEAGLLYAAIAIITDYDCWRDSVVNVEEVKATFAKHKPVILQSVTECVRKIAQSNWNKAIKDAKDTVDGACMS